MKTYIEEKTKGGQILDLDELMATMHFQNSARFLSEYEMKKYQNLHMHAGYSRKNDSEVNVDFYWSLKDASYFPPGYPKVGINANGNAIWESCFCISFFTRCCLARGVAKKVILPAFASEADISCVPKINKRCNPRTQIAHCSISQLEALKAILARFDATGDEEGVEFAATIPCELVVQNG